MAYKEKIIEKKYYTIGDVAEIFGVATSLIRFWETEFEIIKPHKNKKGNRVFTKEDVEDVRIVYFFVKEKGYTLQGAKEMIKMDKNSVKSQNHKKPNCLILRSIILVLLFKLSICHFFSHSFS